MAYEDIYKGLTDEERERMLKADIPKAVSVGKFEMTEDERKVAHDTLMEMIHSRQKKINEKKEQRNGKR